MGSIGVVTRGFFQIYFLPEKLIKLGSTISFLWGLGTIAGPIIRGFFNTFG